jgi:hypothetical protein
VSLLTAGCGKSSPPEYTTPIERNLEHIGNAYLYATNRLTRPPQNLDELMPELKKQGSPDELLLSPNDGEKYEIVWGVELRGMKATGSDIPIIAYEKKGKGGTRYVLRGRREVLQMSASTLKAAKFPSGYQFPF